MSNSGVLANPLGKVGDLGKQVGKGIGSEAEKVEKTARQQVGLENQEDVVDKAADNVQNQPPNTDPSISTLEIVKKMYEASDTKASVPSDKIISKVIEENPKMSPEEIQKLAATRQQLWQQQHTTSYFEPTFNPKKPSQTRPGEATVQEEEEKKKKQMEELQMQEKKKEELAPSVKQGTHEKIPGISG